MSRLLSGAGSDVGNPVTGLAGLETGVPGLETGVLGWTDSQGSRTIYISGWNALSRLCRSLAVRGEGGLRESIVSVISR